jgi:hypothetical protein
MKRVRVWPRCVLISLAVAYTFSSTAFAAPPSNPGNPDPPGHSVDKPGNPEPPGHSDDKPGNTEPPGHADDKPGNPDPGNPANPNPGSPSPVAVVPTTPIGADAALPSLVVPLLSTGPEQDQALQAVEDARAVPLEQIVSALASVSTGQVIDARLVTVGRFLLYEIKVLDADQAVRTLYFYALSGLPVRFD